MDVLAPQPLAAIDNLQFCFQHYHKFLDLEGDDCAIRYSFCLSITVKMAVTTNPSFLLRIATANLAFHKITLVSLA